MRHEQDNDFDLGFDDEEVGGFRKIPKSPKVPRNQDSQKNKNKHNKRREVFERKRSIE